MPDGIPLSLMENVAPYISPSKKFDINGGETILSNLELSNVAAITSEKNRRIFQIVGYEHCLTLLQMSINEIPMHMVISKIIYALVVAFGSCTWIGTNSVWMQLSLFTSELPEGWSLPSYLSVVVQIACIGPLIYTIVHKGCKAVEIPHTRLIFLFLVLACICQLDRIICWINGHVDSESQPRVQVCTTVSIKQKKEKPMED
ncbi:hypothetical protein TELCIR_06690 [Teladorsagia circumcincta]|uniref:Riboflavin transporter n=1 Tax=Teladorsagia circumcincta TaxID=45464 RepID=A0A2G9UMP8_TELCI|nr:hypothetical protein TELCIR_06690 [Teladorsagia circumcincta]